MSELVDVLDESGNKTGQVVARNVAWEQSLPHRSVSVWILNLAGEILVQRRSAAKKLFPNVWDKSAGGGVDAGETAIDAIAREIREEIGLNIAYSDFVSIGSFKDFFKTGVYDIKLIHDVFLVCGDYKISDMIPDTSEVAELKYVTKEWIENYISITDPKISALDRTVFDMLKNWLKENNVGIKDE